MVIYSGFTHEWIWMVIFPSVVCKGFPFRVQEPRSFRDLSKPVGALSEKRLTYFRERMAGMPENQEPSFGRGKNHREMEKPMGKPGFSRERKMTIMI